MEKSPRRRSRRRRKPIDTRTRKESVVRKERPQEGAPRSQEARPDERKYRSLGGTFRNVLTAAGKDPDKVYRWFQDSSEMGQRILNAVNAGWDMVDATKEEIEIGDGYVGNSSKFGSCYVRPANRLGDKLYLMSMPKWAFEKYVEQPKQDKIDETEEELLRERHPENDEDEGQYGTIKVRHGVTKSQDPYPY